MRFVGIRLWLGAAFVCSMVVAAGQNAAPTPEAILPKAEDVASMDSVMKATYDVISGPAGQKRDWGRMRSLFAPRAMLGAAVKTQKGELRYVPMSVDDYIKQAGPYLETHGFFERELSRHVDTFGNIAQVFSTYESKNKIDDKKPIERGINSFQLFNDGKRWWVVSIYWQGEDPTTPIPKKWLRR